MDGPRTRRVVGRYSSSYDLDQTLIGELDDGRGMNLPPEEAPTHILSEIVIVLPDAQVLFMVQPKINRSSHGSS